MLIILKEKNIQDSCIEKKARDRYWKKRNQKKYLIIKKINAKNKKRKKQKKKKKEKKI